MGETLQIKVTRLSEDAVLPARATEWSAGADLCCIGGFSLSPGERTAVPTGLSLEIPPGWYGRIAPRSGLSARYGIDTLAGVIDSDYRGELKVLLINLGNEPVHFNKGERIAQLIIERAAMCDYIAVEQLGDTSRANGGFGSTGK